MVRLRVWVHDRDRRQAHEAPIAQRVGRKQLAKEQENWDRLTRAVAKVLRFA
jgi:hypothetical protein